MPVCEKCGYGGALFESYGSNKIVCPKCFHVGKPVPAVTVRCPTCGQVTAIVLPAGPGEPKAGTALDEPEEEDES